MHDVSIQFAENSWWILGGFIVILGSVCFLAVSAWKLRRNIQSLVLSVVVIGGIWISGVYVDRAFLSFSRFERKGSKIYFSYYFGWSREFLWQDVERITRVPSAKHHSRIVFQMKTGQRVKSFDTDSEAVITDALSLRNDIPE
jgi:hypothetical protein